MAADLDGLGDEGSQSCFSMMVWHWECYRVWRRFNKPAKM